MAPSSSNAHALINAAFRLTFGSSPTADANGSAGSRAVASAALVFGYPGPAGWACHRAAGAEAALLGEPGLGGVLSRDPIDDWLLAILPKSLLDGPASTQLAELVLITCRPMLALQAAR